MTRPAVNSKGQVVYAYTDIAGTATEWAGWHYGRGDNPPRPGAYANYILHDQFLRYMADPTVAEGRRSPQVRLRSRSRVACARAQALRCHITDLRAFKARGGKMLMWHGLSDAAIVATSSIGYFEGV